MDIAYTALAERLVPRPLVSFVVLSAGGQVPAETAAQIERCGLRRDEFEVLSLARTAEQERPSGALASEFEVIDLVARTELPPVVGGMLGRARGRYIVLLDEFCYPRAGSVARMVMHFERWPELGAALFTVHDLYGLAHEHPFPNTIQRCGTAFRRRAIEQAGGFPDDWRSSAAEYDLSVRMLSAGWQIEWFDDLHVTSARQPELNEAPRLLQRRIRDEIQFLVRYFPQRWVVRYARDWMKQYRYLSADRGLHTAYYKGVMGAMLRTVGRSRRRGLDETTFQRITRMDEIARGMAQLKRRYDCGRILLVDLGPNALAWWAAARKLGIGIVAIADEQLHGPRRHYRGIPIVSDADARLMRFDLAVVASPGPRQASQRLAAWQAVEPRPVIDVLAPDPALATTFAAQASAAHRTAARSA